MKTALRHCYVIVNLLDKETAGSVNFREETRPGDWGELPYQSDGGDLRTFLG